MKKIYEGKAKILYQLEDPDTILMVFTNQATALNGKRKEDIAGKAILNTQISTLIFEWLESVGIATQFIKKIDDDRQVVKRLEMIPLEVVVRNRVAGSFAKRFGLEEGGVLSKPTVELFLKDDELDDPFVNVSQLTSLNKITEEECQTISDLALKINDKLIQLFDEAGLILVDIKFEFGKDSSGNIILGDEISPDNCRLWDKVTEEKLDKDRFRRHLGSLTDAYEEVSKRLDAVIAHQK
ncbi:phosphoribosylaminoimidazolesuccinocarboxamide synthase [Bavariicoccus seileri]|uniref:phosphoribosylaminoimidazolesuccinocarboxamide synthase n=1 Tax=Bavariicoccus seileri TaxID=549685 RepID=UPI003F8F13C4